GSFAFRVLDMAAVAAPITAGAAVSGTLSPANTTNLYSFAGTAGSTIFLNNTAFSNSDNDAYGGSWALYDSYGTEVFSNRIPWDSGRVTLPTTGNYTLVVSGDLNLPGTTTYSFNFKPTNDATTSMTLGTPVSGSISVPGQVKNYTFTLAAPTQLWFASQTADGYLSWSLNGPQGSGLSGQPFSFLDTATNLLPAATYTLTVAGYGDYTGSFGFNLLSFAAATSITTGTSASPTGATVGATLNPANSAKLYTFSGTAGDTFLFHNLSFTGDYTEWELIDPYTNIIFDNYLSTDANGVKLPSSGTYTLVVTGIPGNTVAPTYSFQVNYQSHTNPPSVTGTALTLGTPISASIGASGDKAYKFTLAAPTRLWFDSQSNDSNLGWSLTGPQGMVLDGQNFGSDDRSLGLLPAGTYVFDVSGPRAEPFAFNLLDFAAATAVTAGSSVAASLNPADSTKLYSFSGTAGSTIFLDITSFSTTDPSGYSGHWYLYDAFGTQVFLNGLAYDSGRLTLPTTGTYTLLFAGDINANGTATDTFVVRTVSDTTTGITLGTPVSGSIASQGQQANYTFTLASPTQLWFDTQTADDSLLWSLAGPQGNVDSGFSFGSEDQDISLLQAGTYTLTVAGNGDYTGSFTFNLLGFAAATAATPGSSVVATLNPANSAKLYSFSGTAGSTLFLDNTAFTTGSNLYTGNWHLYDAFGTQVYSGNIANDSGRLALPTTGTYTLVIAGDLNANGVTTDTFVVRTVSDATAALTLGTAVSGSITGVGQQRNYTFTLASPTKLWFDSQTDDANLEWSLAGLQGSVGGITAFAPEDQGINVLPAGTYTLTVFGNGDHTGSFKFNLLDYAAATPITVGSAATPTGQTVSASLSPANSTKLYRFTGTAGDSLLFHTISSSGDYATWRLYDSFNTPLFDTSVADDNGGVILPTSGTYTLVLAGALDDTASPTVSFLVNYQSHTNPAPVTGTVLTLGSPVSASVSSGGIDNYQFTLANPTRLWFDVRTNDGSLSWALAGPQGSVLAYENFGSDDQNIGLLPAGTYSLQVNGPAGDGYAFSLLDFAAATSITPGTAINASLNPSNSANLYKFSGTAGSTIFLDSTAVTSNDPNYGSLGGWTLYDGYGVPVFDGNMQVDSGRVTLPTTGTYTLVVHGALANTSSVSYSFIVLPVTDNIKQLWGTSGNDSIVVQYLDANTRDVYLNGYLEGTLSGTAPFTIMGMGGTDSLSVIGTGAADTFTISPTQISLGSSANFLVGITNISVDGSGGTDTFNYSGANPKLTLLGGAGLDTFAPADNASILKLDGGA
ncbi:beta strand repeat-containing protein, partial [Singulisphaera rosea]